MTPSKGSATPQNGMTTRLGQTSEDGCQRCGHELTEHGRRGHGACHRRGWTDYGRQQAERINEEQTAKGAQPIVTLRVLETLFALPGMHKTCDCKRFARRKAAA